MEDPNDQNLRRETSETVWEDESAEGADDIGDSYYAEMCGWGLTDSSN